VDDDEDIEAAEAEQAEVGSERQQGRQRLERLWDDAGFCERYVQVCEARGVTPQAVNIAIGTSPKYHLMPAPNGRNTNIVMRIAKHLNVHPAYLMFNITPDSEAPPLTVSAKTIDKAATAGQRLAMIGQICALYWMHASIDANAADSIADVILREIATITR
jgi:hypothetical protein